MNEQIQVDKHVYATYNSTGKCKTKPISQPDYGRVLVLQGVTLPESYQVYFSNNAVGGVARGMIGNAEGVTIPDEYVQTGKTIYARYFLHADNISGQNEFWVIIPNKTDGLHDDDDPTPVEQSEINDAIAALQQAVADADAAVAHYPKVGEDGYWYVWNVSTGEWVNTHVPASGDPSILIDDTAGAGVTDRTWSANKLSGMVGDTPMETSADTLTGAIAELRNAIATLITDDGTGLVIHNVYAQPPQ